jgi:hypothetical protein
MGVKENILEIEGTEVDEFYVGMGNVDSVWTCPTFPIHGFHNRIV